MVQSSRVETASWPKPKIESSLNTLALSFSLYPSFSLFLFPCPSHAYGHFSHPFHILFFDESLDKMRVIH